MGFSGWMEGVHCLMAECVFSVHESKVCRSKVFVKSFDRKSDVRKAESIDSRDVEALVFQALAMV